MDTPLTDVMHPLHWDHVARVLAKHGHRRPALPLTVPAAGGSSPLFSGQCLLLGWSLTDGSGAANGVVLRGGIDATSQTVAATIVAASGADTKWFGPTGVRCDSGVFITQSGALTGAVYVLPIH